MGDHELTQLARDLEWLGCELEYTGHQHAMQGFPQAGPAWRDFLRKQQGVLRTADKIERELKNAVRFNPEGLVDGVEFPIDTTLDSITDLLAAVEKIKWSAVFAVDALPAKVRTFTKKIENYLDETVTQQG